MAISVFIAALAVIFFTVGDKLDVWFAGEQGLEWLKQQGPWAGIAGIGLIVADLFLPMPTSGVMAGLGQIYGGFVGGLYSAAGSVAAGMVAYGLTRLIGPRAADMIAGAENIAKLKRFYEQRGAWAIALTRVLPLIPEVLCCLAGLSRMPFGKFLAALVSGSLPLSFLFSYFGSLAGDEPFSYMLIAVAAPAVVFLPIWLVVLRVSDLPVTEQAEEK